MFNTLMHLQRYVQRRCVQRYAQRSLAAIVIAATLASCVTPSAKPNPDEVSSATLTNFEVSGGLGIWTKDENISSRMRWQQRAEDFSFDLSAPLGMAALKVDQVNRRTTVTRGNTIVARASDPGIALQQALGLSVPVPVAQIAQWLKGQPGEADSSKFNDAGLLESMIYTDQSGVRWQAVIRKRTEFQGAQVPALITARGGPYNVRILLKSWKALEPNSPEPETTKPSQRLAIPTQ